MTTFLAERWVEYPSVDYYLLSESGWSSEHHGTVALMRKLERKQWAPAWRWPKGTPRCIVIK